MKETLHKVDKWVILLVISLTMRIQAAAIDRLVNKFDYDMTVTEPTKRRRSALHNNRRSPRRRGYLRS